MVEPKAQAQLPALPPEESRRTELDDCAGEQFLGSLASVARNAHSLAEMWLQIGIHTFKENQSPGGRETGHVMVLILHVR